MQCPTSVSERNIKEQIVDNIRNSKETPEQFIPTADRIDLNNWELECDNKGKVVAQGELHSNEGDWYSCTLQKVFVDESRRGEGLGRMVVNRLIEKAKHKKVGNLDDCQLLTADINRSNLPSRNLFESSGFKITNSFCVPGDNVKADVLRMTLNNAKISGCNKE